MALKEGTYDLSLSEIGSEVREEAARAAGDLFSSIEFSTLYGNISAQRLWFRVDQGGRMAAVFPYWEGGWIFKRIHIFGPAAVDGSEVMQLMRARGAGWATIGGMAAAHLAGTPDAWHQPKAVPTLMSVVELPSSEEEYLERLGSQTRKHLPYYVRRLGREWPDMEVVYLAKEEISREIMEELVGLSRARIEAKGKPHGGFSGKAFGRRWELARRLGVLCGVRHEGRLVGGTLSYIHGQTSFLVMVGHDPRFDRLNLGNACLWLTVKRMIEAKMRQFNLGWGQSFYKKQFGAVERTIFEVPICRNIPSACVLQAVRGFDAVARLVIRARNQLQMVWERMWRR